VGLARAAAAARAVDPLVLHARLPRPAGMQGKTPEATLSAALYTEAKKPDGAVDLVERGPVIRHTRRLGVTSTLQESGFGKKQTDSKTGSGASAVETWGINPTPRSWNWRQKRAQTLFPKRRGWDSNPGTSCPVSGFQDRPVRPLRHPAELPIVAGG
jgi:hypothetical protein